MRKPLALCSLALCLTACAPADKKIYDSLEERKYPSATLGTDNSESAWYKTQILASPPAPTATTAERSAAAPATNAPAVLPKKAVPTRAPSPKNQIGVPSGSV